MHTASRPRRVNGDRRVSFRIGGPPELYHTIPRWRPGKTDMFFQDHKHVWHRAYEGHRHRRSQRYTVIYLMENDVILDKSCN